MTRTIATCPPGSPSAVLAAGIREERQVDKALRALSMVESLLK